MEMQEDDHRSVDGSATPAELPPTELHLPIQPPPEHHFATAEAEQALPTPKQRHKVGKALCGAKTRKGLPCVRRVVEGKARCPNHGGLSTGPKTADGRARCTMNLPNVRAMVLKQATGIG